MSTTRTFVAIALDPQPLGALERLVGRLRARIPAVRWVDVGNLHLTLAFLGDVPNEQLPHVCEAVRRAAAGIAPFALALHGLGGFPGLRRPRVLWVGCGTGSESVSELHQAVEAELEPLGFHREQRAYVPHLTIGRTQRHGRLSPAAVAEVARRADWDGGLTQVARVDVMGSVLDRGGPTYTVISRTPLGP